MSNEIEPQKPSYFPTYIIGFASQFGYSVVIPIMIFITVELEEMALSIFCL